MHRHLNEQEGPPEFHVPEALSIVVRFQRDFLYRITAIWGCTVAFLQNNIAELSSAATQIPILIHPPP